jgi:large subunit ribosomal protein L15
LIINDPDHFGRDPFRPPGHFHPSTWVNVGRLDGLAKGSKTLDLSMMGIEKLLGSGEVGGAYEIKVLSFTKKAQSKIEAAGGKILVQE